MRFIVDLEDDGGRVSGEVSAANERPIRFTGWLELLRALEDGTRTDRRTGHQQEATWDG